MGERAKPYPTPISAPKEEETKLFQIYWVFLYILVLPLPTILYQRYWTCQYYLLPL